MPSIKLKKNQTVDLELLDQLLDLPVEGFERGVRRLIKEFAAKNISVAVPELERVAEIDRRVGVSGVFQAELRQMPKMDRAEEFRMARRHEFLSARAEAALAGAGCPADEINELARQAPEKVLVKLSRSKKPRQAEYLKRTLTELQTLRRRYVEGALYLVTNTAYRYRGLGVDFVDLVQEGNASLFQAIDGFDWRREVRFKTYAAYWVQQAVLKTLYNASRTVRVPVWVQKLLHKINRLRQQEDPATGTNMSWAAIAQELDIPESRIEELLATRRYAVSLDAPLGDDGVSRVSLLADEDQEPIPEQIEDIPVNESIHAELGDLTAREQLILNRRFGLRDTEPETLAEIAVDLGITAERVRQVQNAAMNKLKGSRQLQRLADSF